MTEGLNQNQATDSSALENSAPSEKMISQSQANFIISKAKEEAYLKGKQEALANAKSESSMSSQQMEEMLEKKVEEKLKAVQNHHVANQIVNQHHHNVMTGRKKYEDFDPVVSSINFDAAYGLLPLINTMPNAPDVLYHLGKEDERFNQINLALLSNQPKKAESLMKKLSDSISSNEEAKQKAEKVSKAPAPLSQLKSSTTGVDGTMSIADLRKMMNKRRTG